MLASGINYLRNHSTIDVFFRELTANNLPRIAIVRNMDEAVDVAITQFGNMASFNGTGFLVQGLIDKMTPSLQKNLSDQGKEWFRLGKSFSIFSMIGAMMYG
ncbi:MAG: hypothetical protein KTR14_07020, partial [Vampirovibrio sp.]|nr:hypothetical protein [Vampirovibrio sp.]